MSLLPKAVRAAGLLDRERPPTGFAAGALATDYGGIRRAEHVLDPATNGFNELPTLRHTEDFDAFMAGNKVNKEGEAFLVYHGTLNQFDQFSNEELGSNTGAASARMGHFFASNPEVASEGYAKAMYQFEGWRTVRNPLRDVLLMRKPLYEEQMVHSFQGAGANVRPTYLRMTNPFELTDRELRQLSGPEAWARELSHPLAGNIDPEYTGWGDQYYRDDQGFHWKVRRSREDDGSFSYAFGKILDKDRQTVPGDTIEYAPQIMEDPISRTINYADIIDQAKKAGHDGVIIRNTLDGSNQATDVYVVFDPKTQIRGFDQRWKVTPDEGGTLEGYHQPGSVGAQLSPESFAYQQDVLLAQGRLVPTGIGLEHLPLNPVVRAFQGASVSMMRLVADLVSTGGLQTVGNREGIANLAPVEAMIAQRWNHPTVAVLRATQDQWSAYRAALAKASETPPDAVTMAGRSDAARYAEQVGTAIKDYFTPGEKPLSFGEFQSRVGKSLNNADQDRIRDGATPYVEAAVAEHRKIYAHTRERALETGVFDEAYNKALDHAQSQLKAVEKEADEIARKSKLEKWDAERTRQAEEALMARIDDAKFKFKQAQDALADLRAHGPTLAGTAPSYRPRMPKAQMLLDNEKEFIDIVTGWLMRSRQRGDAPLELPEAARIAKQIHEIWSRSEPLYERGDMEALFKSVTAPGSALARSFRIPDHLIEKFLEDDAETLLRFHTKQMGAAIEMKERFGSLDLAEQIAEVERDYRNAIAKANEGSSVATDEARALTRQMKTALADAQALRDKIYGTYGASPDPHRWSSRTIRMAKQFSNITLLGMSGITALGDLVRPVMTEGLDAVYGYGIKTLMSDSRSLILKMNRRELELEGNGMELYNNVRALSAADTGDVFGKRGQLEHALSTANSWMFVANGLNAVNQIDKEWARLSIGGRVNSVLLDWEAGVRPSQRDIGRFAAAGIDEQAARRIAIQLKVHGVDFGSGGAALTMPNTAEWTDTWARDVYRSAMYQMVNRTVPTPGIGDRPNFMSTEIGGLLTQYKSFGMGTLIRTTYAGLQEDGVRFWQGAAMAVGFAIILNELRSQLFYEKSTFDKPLAAVIADGVERSSILGILSDGNRAIETLTGNRVGVKPLIGASTPTQPTLANVAGVFGPSAGQAARVVSVANDHLTGHTTAQTWRNWRSLTPGGNLPYTDPIFDRLYPQAANRPKRERRQQPKAE